MTGGFKTVLTQTLYRQSEKKKKKLCDKLPSLKKQYLTRIYLHLNLSQILRMMSATDIQW